MTDSCIDQLTPSEKSESKEVVRHLEALKTRAEGNSQTGKYVTRIRWTMDNAGLLAPGFMLKSERVVEIEELEGGKECVVRCWISFAGLGAKLVKRKWEGTLQERALDLMADLRKRSLYLYKKVKAEGGDVLEGEKGLVNGHGEKDVEANGQEVEKETKEEAGAAVGVLA